MTAVPRHFFKGWTRTDVLLLALAVVGAILYVVLLPAQHPDAAASYALGGGDARAAADAFLAESGYALDRYDAGVELYRDTDLLNALQAELGRPAARRVLEDEAAEVPAYHWRVWYKPSENAEDGEGDALPAYEVRVTPDGGVWDFERSLPRPRGDPSRPPQQQRQFLDAGRRVDRNAFHAVAAAALTAPGVEGAGPAVDLGLLTDSLISTSFTFNAEDTLWRRDPASLQPYDASNVRTLLKLRRENPNVSFSLALEPAFAVALARHHLGRMSWDAETFLADSMWVLPGREDRLARVRLVRAEPLYGQRVQADALVSAGGALLELDVDVETSGRVAISAEAGGDGVVFDSEGDAEAGALAIVAGVAGAVFYVVIAIALFVTFFRRLAAQLVDRKAIFIDLAVVGLAMAVGIGLIKDLDFGENAGSVWVRLLLRLLAASVTGGLVGLFALTLSGAADSIARDVWATKLRASSLVRLGAFRNVFVGAALLRGVGLAFVLLGLVVGFLSLFPGATIRFETGSFLDAQTWQPMLWRASWSGLQAYFITLMVLLGVGTFVYRFRSGAGWVVAAVVVTMAVVRGLPLEVNPVPYAWGLAALWGLALGLAFWRYDFLTCFTGFFAAQLILSLSEGWLVDGSPAVLDVWLAGLFVLGLAALGGRGIASGETRRAVTEYVPTYITDLKHRERLQSELDIARQVQESFLPRRMPDVPGLDIAAMCLAAHEVGGDYYDFVAVGPGKLAVVVGDVSGKGTQAAFYMTLTKGIIQTLSREALSPAEVMRRLNALFCENAPRGTFISMIYGVFDVEARTFTFARAGHNPVILKRSPSQESDLVQPTGLAIGLVSGSTFDTTIEERTIKLRVGDVLVFYTDGFSEAMNGVKDQYGDHRLARKVSDVGQRSATEILHAVAEDVHHFVEAAGRHDDMTMVVVKLDRSATFAGASSAHQHAVA